MIILQTAGSGDASGIRVGGRLLAELGGQATTYEDNDYIHRLNRTLQAEMRAVAAYRSLSGHAQSELACGSDRHQRAGRELVRLIIENRGIPEDKTALSFGLTRQFIRLVVKVPSRIAERVTLGTLLRIETQLTGSYKKLLDLAPLRDQPVLQELLKGTQAHVASLNEIS